ncbi:MAG: alpha-D-ribose 1-methylphosphonate 5-triphosphate diphosphatase [Sphingomonadaceae bacterium]
MQTILTNARIILADAVLHGTVVIEDGDIVRVDEGIVQDNAEDMGGDFIMPGIIDIHTDNLERHYFPRQNIDWNPVSAAIAHDGVCVASGITTVFDSMSLGAWANGEARTIDNLRRLIDGMETASDAGALRATHFIHWRCELPSPALPALLDEFVPRRMTRLASFMDHTPGQRQYKNLEFYLDRTWRREGLSDAQIADRLVQRQQNQENHVAANRMRVSRLAADLGITLATHDDETADHIIQSHAAGATIAEFPVTSEAAAEARRLGMVNIMGGPNLIRGGSYSGNVSAADLVADTLLDGFASDYVPRSLIECPFRLADSRYGWSLPQAVATVTSAVADATGLHDRGEIAAGKRADVLRVSIEAGLPVVRSVWVSGERVA